MTLSTLLKGTKGSKRTLDPFSRVDNGAYTTFYGTDDDELANPISHARLDQTSSAAWYTSSNPLTSDKMEVAFLGGQDTLFLD